MEKSKLRIKKVLWEIFISLLLISLTFVGGIYFSQTHFLFGTRIENVPCSFLSIEKAIEKINLEKGEKIVTFSFANRNTYYVVAKELGIRVDEARVTQIFEQQHSNPKETREYSLDGFLFSDPEKLRNFLGQIPELQEENMVEPQNAYMVWNDVEFSIHKDVLGNVIDFEEAVKLASKELKNGVRHIDFSSITDVVAEILTEDLVKERNELNLILKNSINFELSDGNVVTLDSSIIKNWVKQDENGKFTIDVENGVPTFVEELAIKVNEANSYMLFAPTDYEGFVTVYVPMELRAQLNKEGEITEIKKLLRCNFESVYSKPIYDRALISDNLISYAEIDKSRQHVWFYKGLSLLVDTPCVTGNARDGYDTPSGVFSLLNKNMDVPLEGFNKDGTEYSVTVKYWMRFYEGYGMHEAYWRSQFGGDIYLTNGSHGCVNLPEDAAAIIYENIDETVLIIVYQSEL